MLLHYKVAIEQIEQVQIDVTWNCLIRKHRGEQQKSKDHLIDTNESNLLVLQDPIVTTKKAASGEQFDRLKSQRKAEDNGPKKGTQPMDIRQELIGPLARQNEERSFKRTRPRLSLIRQWKL